MRNEIVKHVGNCTHCGKAKAYTKPPPLTPIIILRRRQRIIFDLVDMGKDAQDYRYILVAIDCFTKRIWTFPLKTKESKDVLAW